MVALALPLAPLAPGAAAAAGTFVIGSAAYIAQQVHGFRAPLRAPMIPRTGGKAGGATMREMVADALAGARIPVAFPPNPLGPRGSLGLVGLLAAAGFLGSWRPQSWGQVNSRSSKGPKIGGETEEFSGGLTRYRVTTSTTIKTTGIAQCSNGQPSPDTSSGGPVTGNWAGPFEKVRVNAGPGTTTVAYNCSGATSTTTTRTVVSGVRADGTTLDLATFDLISGTINNSGAWRGTRTYTGAVSNIEGENGWRWDRSERPDGVPAFDPQPLPSRPVTVPAPPEIAPTPQPEPERSPTPTTPGPARPPVTVPAPPSTAPKAPPVPARVIVVRPDGKLPAPAKDPVAVTHPDAHYPIPGGGPIVGNGPQAKPEEIAKELGRLEQKLNGILNPTPDTPIEWRNLLQQVLEAITNLTDGTTYTITEKCPPCDPDQQYDPPTVEAEAPGALNAFGVITNRLDAIAKLLDGQLGLKQQVCPPCKPTIRGQLVTINFQSDPAEVPSRYAIKKHLSYRDQSGRDEEFHIQHWQGFSWDTGAAIVTSRGLPWGVVQVWAVDNAEGQRVIAHAATAAGVNLNDPKHVWEFGTTNHPRYGRQGTVWPVKWDESGKLMISKRGGPAGLPGYKRDPGVP